MALFTYALIENDQIVEYRTYPQQMQVGPGAPGEFADMVAATAPASAPAPPTPRAWLERLSPATQNAITAAAAKDTSGALLLWLLRAAGNPTIDVTSSETVAGVAALVSLGIITAQDQTTLLTP